MSESSYYDEIFVRIKVENPLIGLFVTYEITVETNNSSFSSRNSVVRRRYSEFRVLRKLLLKQFPSLKIPRLPPKYPFQNHFDPVFIERRRAALEEFLILVTSERIYLSSKALHLFLQSSLSISEIKSIVLSKALDDEVAMSGLYERFQEACISSTSSDERMNYVLSNTVDIAENVHFNVNVNPASNLQNVPGVDSPMGSKRVSFCDHVTVAEIHNLL